MFRQRSLLVGQPAPPEEDSAETGGGAQLPHLQQQGFFKSVFHKYSNDNNTVLFQKKGKHYCCGTMRYNMCF